MQEISYVMMIKLHAEFNKEETKEEWILDDWMDELYDQNFKEGFLI
jgi:hypothetical protein